MHWVWRLMLVVLLLSSAIIFFKGVTFIELFLSSAVAICVMLYAGYDVYIHHLDKKNEEINRYRQ